MKQYLEVIFENRNKGYGAYELRLNYSDRMMKALIITMLAAGLLISLTIFGKKNIDNKPNYNFNEVTLVDINKDKPIEKPKEEPKPLSKKNPVKTVKYVVPVIVPNDQVKDPLPDQEEIDESKIGTNNIKGSIDSGIVAPPSNEGIDKGIIDDSPKEDIIFTKVEVEASFPGGADKWKRYLERTLNPETPVSNGAPEGAYRVLVQFVVDIEGNISDIQSVTNFGYGMEEEAVKVIRKGPKWEPAIQNGIKVKAYRKQMITFVVSN